MRFVLATANPDKAREIIEIINGRLELLPRPADVAEVPETSASLVGNALLKARALVAATGSAALADDTGLEVDALGGAPGVYSARYAGESASYRDNVTLLLSELKDRHGPDARKARFVTAAVAVLPDGSEHVAHGAVDGWIGDEPRGAGGFGYDPVFVPVEGDGRSFAELVDEDPGAKHRLSHRARAFEALISELAGIL